MKLISIFKSLLILVSIIFYGCIEKKANIEIQPQDRTNCLIEEVKDTALYPGDNVVGYKFICDNYTKEINLLETNPWRHAGFPMLLRDNPYLTFGSNVDYERLHKKGFLYYDLELASWDSVKLQFQVTPKDIPDSLVFTYAKIDCRSMSYLPEFVLTNYWLSVQGVKDTTSLKNRTTFFLENQIKIYGSNGETVFSLITNDYVSTGAKIDSTKRFLLFRTFRIDSISTYTGVEIYSIADNALLQKFESDSSYMFYEPALFGNYAIFEVFRNQIPINTHESQRIPYKAIVYDMSRNVFYHWIYPKNYKFQFMEISGSNLIYNFGDDEYVPVEYDTIQIASLDTLTAQNN